MTKSYSLNLVKSYSYLLAILLFISTSFAKSEEPKPCFNFEEKSLTPLKAAPPKIEEGKDLSEKGTLNKNSNQKIDWANVGGVINKPIKDLYTKLLDPKTIRNGDNVRVEQLPLPPKNFLKFFELTVDLRPRWFLKLLWKENWAFVLKDGTAEAPKSILIAYQKFEGTSHIEHFCGNILLQELAPNKTQVFIYQEMKASRRDAQNILDDITGTLRTLR